MKSKTSFINRGILSNDFKRYTWVGIVYLLGLLATVPLQLVMAYTQPEEIKAGYNAYTYLRVLQFDYSPLPLMLLLIVPVLTGLLLFRYLQSGKAADMEHALPIKRETLYNTHILAGLVFLLVPVIITALVSWALVAGLGIDFLQGKDILAWLNAALLMNLLLFMSTVAVGMFTGLSAVQGLLTYILLLVPSGLSFLILHNLSMYVYGFPYDYYGSNLEKLSPLLRLPVSNQPLQTGEIVFYLLICAVLYFLGRYLYQRRKIEAAGDAITFEVLRPIFKYAVTFCTMLLLGSYFHDAQGSISWTYFGYLLGAVLGYFLTEILLNKSLYVFQWQRVKGLGIYGLVIIGLIGLLYTDCTGYEKRLPELSQIENVYMDSYFHPLIYGDEMYARGGFKPSKAIFIDQDSIARIHTLHQQIIAHRGEEKGAALGHARLHPERRERVCLAYELKNGRHIYRNYVISAAAYKEQLKPIYESREYKIHHYEVLRANPDTVKLIDLYSCEGNKHVRIVEPDRIKQAIAVLQKDVLAQSFEEMTMNERPPWANINIMLALPDSQDNMPAVASDGTMTVPQDNYYQMGMSWQKSYVNFERWLQSAGLYDKARVLPGEDIVHAIINYAPGGVDENSYRKLMEAQNMEEKPGVLKLTDPDKLELCLRKYQGGYTKGPAYTVFFKVYSGNNFSGTIPSAEAPDFIRQHFVR